MRFLLAALLLVSACRNLPEDDDSTPLVAPVSQPALTEGGMVSRGAGVVLKPRGCPMTDTGELWFYEDATHAWRCGPERH